MDIFNDLSKHRIKYGNIVIPVIFDENDQAWFGAKEVTLALKYPDTESAFQSAIRKNILREHRKLYKKFIFDSKDFNLRKLFIKESGLYRLMLRSRKPEAIKFSMWVTDILLPRLRKFRSYTLSKEYDEKYINIMQKISFLENENRKLKNDNKLKKKYPNGGLVYVVDYSNEFENIFRIGQTVNMKLRKSLYDTHTLHNQPVVYLQETDSPLRLESCVRVLLYKYKYNKNNNKDFFECDLKIIKTAFKRCIASFAEMENQVGGGKSSSFFVDNLINSAYQNQLVIQNKIIKLDKKMVHLDKQIESEQELLKDQINHKKLQRTGSGSKTANPKRIATK
jgi:prophage antirepressor-like protein